MNNSQNDTDNSSIAESDGSKQKSCVELRNQLCQEFRQMNPIFVAKNEEAIERQGFKIDRIEPLFAEKSVVYHSEKFSVKENIDLVVKLTLMDSIPNNHRKHYVQHSLVLLKLLSQPVNNKMRHISLIRVIEIFVSYNKSYIFMQEFPCKNLEMFVKQKYGLLVEESYFVVRQIIEAINFLHRHGVAHLNIKTNNFIFDIDSNVKLTGMNRMFLFWDDETQSIIRYPKLLKVQFINREYYPSDVFRGDFETAPIDVFSFGVVLCKIWIKSSPFKQGPLIKGNRDVDTKWKKFTQQHRARFANLQPQCVELMNKIFFTDPKERITFEQMENADYFKGVSKPVNSVIDFQSQIGKASEVRSYNSMNRIRNKGKSSSKKSKKGHGKLKITRVDKLKNSKIHEKKSKNISLARKSKKEKSNSFSKRKRANISRKEKSKITKTIKSDEKINVDLGSNNKNSTAIEDKPTESNANKDEDKLSTVATAKDTAKDDDKLSTVATAKDSAKDDDKLSTVATANDPGKSDLGSTLNDQDTKNESSAVKDEPAPSSDISNSASSSAKDSNASSIADKEQKDASKFSNASEMPSSTADDKEKNKKDEAASTLDSAVSQDKNKSDVGDKDTKKKANLSEADSALENDKDGSKKVKNDKENKDKAESSENKKKDDESSKKSKDDNDKGKNKSKENDDQTDGSSTVEESRAKSKDD